MLGPEIMLVILVLFRIKFPGHRFSQELSYTQIFDWLVRGSVLALATQGYLQSQKFQAKLLLAVILPHCPWYILADILSTGYTGLLTSFICIYGLDQPPFNNILLYKVYKATLLILALSNILFYYKEL